MTGDLGAGGPTRPVACWVARWAETSHQAPWLSGRKRHGSPARFRLGSVGSVRLTAPLAFLGAQPEPA